MIFSLCKALQVVTKETDNASRFFFWKKWRPSMFWAVLNLPVHY